MIGLMKELVRPKKRSSSQRTHSPYLDRTLLASHYVRGQGIEIGALHNPLVLPPQASVQYVDRLPVEELRKHYPELNDLPLVDVDILDDGEKLDKVTSGSQDFVIANHFLEHCEDPIGTLNQFFRVLKQEGILYLAVPDKRFTFDRQRQETPLGHLFCDHEHGPHTSRAQHLHEWVWLVNQAKDEADAQRQIEHLEAIRYSIHYHVWTQSSWLEFMLAMRARLGFEIETFLQSGHEMISILRKQNAA